jgi:hypothetical protein
MSVRLGQGSAASGGHARGKCSCAATSGLGVILRTSGESAPSMRLKVRGRVLHSVGSKMGAFPVNLDNMIQAKKNASKPGHRVSASNNLAQVFVLQTPGVESGRHWHSNAASGRALAHSSMNIDHTEETQCPASFRVPSAGRSAQGPTGIARVDPPIAKPSFLTLRERRGRH